MDATAWNNEDHLGTAKTNLKVKFTDSLAFRAALVIISTNLVVLNLILLQINFFSGRKATPNGAVAEMVPVEATGSAAAKSADLKKLQEEFSDFAATVTASLSCKAEEVNQPIATQALPTSNKKLTPKLEILSFPGARGTNSTTWWDIPGMELTFNIGDYPNATAYWEALLRIKEGGKASARIFDVNAGIPIVGSEIEATSGDLVRVSSGSLSFWPAKRTYRVQVKSQFGSEAAVEDAKIRISWLKEE